MEFKKFDLESRDKIRAYFAKKPYKMGSERNFTVCFLWQDFNFEYAEEDGSIFVRTFYNGKYHYRMPYTEKEFWILADYVHSLGDKLCLFPLDEDDVSLLNSICPDKFEIAESRDAAEYIYTSEKLINLKGKKLHSKRNFLKRFLENDFTYEKITESNLEKAREFTLSRVQDETEFRAMVLLFDNFKKLELQGAMLFIDGEIVALSIGEKFSDNVAVIHVEKAKSEIVGAYAAINNLFVKNTFSDVEYINRQEDMGIETLRKAKLSYYPDILLMKYKALEK